MKKTLRLLSVVPLSTQRDAIEFNFHFSFIDSNLIGRPEENSSTQPVTIVTSITGTLHTMWSNSDPSFDVLKVLFEFSKRHLSEKLKEGTLLPKEELWLSTATQPSASPFESKKIQMEIGKSFDVEISGAPIMENHTYMQLATNIIETRDYINGVSKEKLGGKLLSLLSERDLLQLFREAKTEEDFVYRMSALKNMATSLNDTLLKSKIGSTKTITGSINLLEEYLKLLPDYDETPV